MTIKYYTPPKAAKYITKHGYPISRITIFRYIKAKKIRARKLNKRAYIISAYEVEKLLNLLTKAEEKIA